jgi:hypothetical protein
MLFSGFAFAEDTCGELIQKARAAQDPVRELRAALDFRLTPACVVEILLLREDAHVLNAILVAGYKSATQNVQQSGSSAGSGGSTNLLSKSLSSRALSFASEYGALTQTSSGQTTTVSGTVSGIPLALEADTHDLIAECPLNLLGSRCVRSGLLDVLGRMSYSVAMNSTQASQLKGTVNGPVQGTAQPVNVQSSGSSATVSQITGKFVIIQPAVKFTALTKALQTLDSNSTLQKEADALAAAAKTLRGYQENAGQDSDGSWNQWVTSTAQQLSNTPTEDVVNEWRKQGDALAKVLEQGAQKGRPSDDELTQAALKYAATFAAYGSAERSFFESSQLTKPVLSFEYDENRPTSQPSNSVFRLIYSQTAKGWTLTGNAAASIYDSTRSGSIPGAQRLRDVQLAFEGDHDLPMWGILGTPTFSVSFYFQDQTSPAILNVTPSSPVSGVTFAGLSSNATQVFAEKGKINIGQLKLALGSSKSGLRFPIAITGSNRTELITKSKLGGQIGISYDFDSLFTK